MKSAFRVLSSVVLCLVFVLTLLGPAPVDLRSLGVEWGEALAYEEGQCTWWVQQRAGVTGWSVPESGMGNAGQWDESALAKGWVVDSTPMGGAIMVLNAGCGGVPADGVGHVAFVERVNSDGTVRRSECNWGLKPTDECYGLCPCDRDNLVPPACAMYIYRPQPTLFEHIDYAGAWYPLTSGLANFEGHEFKYPEGNGIGLNDAVSSIWMPPLWNAIYFKDRDYGCGSILFDCPNDDFHNLHFTDDVGVGDKGSSIKISDMMCFVDWECGGQYADCTEPNGIQATNTVNALTVSTPSSHACALQPPPSPPPPGTWYVEYFSDMTLTTRCSPANMTTDGTFVLKDWGDGNAYPDCPSDNWSARFWRTVSFQSGTYTFGLGSDDWSRLKIGGDLVVNNWPPASQHYESRTLSAGDYQVTIEYADTLGSARLAAWWWGPGYEVRRESRDPYQWYAQYWGNKDLWWDSIVRANEGTGTLNHSWGSGGPGYGIPVDQFSSRFERQAYFDCGTYDFYISTDDGVRFWIDGANRFDSWQDQADSFTVPNVTLSEGYHELKVEHYENGGGANLSLSWSQLGGCVPSAPTNLVATTASQSQINLAWTDNATNEDGFKLERSLDRSNWTLIATLGTNLVSYSDTGLNPDTTYYYRVYAFNAAGDSPYSNVVDATTPAYACPPITEWKGEYWNNVSLSGTPALCRNDESLDFEWYDQSPDPVIQADQFSARWTREYYFDYGWYTFTVFHDDGFRFYVDGSILFQNWCDDCRGTDSYTWVIGEGAHELKLEMAEYQDSAAARLSWAPYILPPAEPTALAATAVSPSQIDLTWVDNADNEDGFRIERSLAETTGFTSIATLSADVTSYSDIGLSPDTTYYYRIYAFNTAGDSWTYAADDTTTFSPPPDAPSNLAATAVSESQIDLTWVDNAGNEDGFKLERSLDGTNWTLIATLGTNLISYSDTGLKPGTTYYYRVYAFNRAGDSTYATDDATTLPVGERTIHVPQDYPTISQALAAASPGDTVQVAAGTYSEQNIGIPDGVVLLGSGADQTMIQGNGTGTVVYIGGNAVISGFTVTGSGTDWWNSGIWISDGQAKISENIVTGNSMGIVYYCFSPCESQPRIQNNIVFKNKADGILVHDGIVTAVNNTSVYNGMTGIAVDRAGSTIANNVFSGNRIGIAATSTAPLADYNNVWGNGEDYNLASPGAHDISADPLFVSVSADDYRIKPASPNADSGASFDLDIDIEGDSRPYDGNGDGTATFDIGADEYVGPPALPPLSPSGLVATAVSESQIDLTWVDNAGNEDGFRIERSLSETSGFTEIDTVGADVASYSDAGLSPGTHYYYRVYAVNTVGDSATYAAGDATTPSLPPATPSSLVATAVSASRIDLTWVDNASNEDGFELEHSLDGSTGWTRIVTLGADITSYPSVGLSGCSTYYYRVRAFNTVGDSPYSNVASATTPCIPVAPSDLAATALSQSQIDLTWTDNADNEDGFRIERSLYESSGFAQIDTVSTDITSYSDTGLSAGTHYYYRVYAFNTVGNSAYSDVADGTTPSLPPAAPSDLVASTVSQSQIDLTWVDNAGNEDGFRIERSLYDTSGFTPIATLAADSTSYASAGLSAGTTYYYRVYAFNTAGDSAFAVASATTDPSAGNLHVGDLDGSKTSANKKFWWAGVTILIHDAEHNPASGATVTGSWGNGVTGTSSCITDQSGECNVASDKIGLSDTSVTFSVDSVSHATLPYDPTANQDPEGDSDGTTIVVSQAGNQSPVASFTYECAGLSCTFDGAGSSDPDGTIVDYVWDFGDGNSGAGATISHMYLTDGTYTVSLTVTDDMGAADTGVATIVVTQTGSQPPVASFTYECADLTCTFDGSGSSDPDGTIVTYAWDFGDGTSGTGATASHPYLAEGTFTVSLTVTDNGGTTDSETQNIAVGANPMTMRVSAIDMTGKTAGSNRSATVVVTIVDGYGYPLSGASVSGTWSDAYSTETSGITGADGTVSFTSGKVRQANARFTFTVEGVVRSGCLYDAEHSVTSAWIIVP
jgi:surface antigen/PKD repeat protein